MRDAKTILRANWPDRFPLHEIEQNIVAKIMVDYAIQCERRLLGEFDEETRKKVVYMEQCIAGFKGDMG